MKLSKVFSTVALFCLVVVGITTAADATKVTLTSSGPSPSALTVRVGTGIGFTGLKDGSFYGGIVTSAPAGSTVTVGGDEQWLAGCLDFGFNPDVAGTYSFEVAYDGATYTGTVTATGDTVYVSYTESGSGASRYAGPSPSALNVHVGDVVGFWVDPVKYCADQIYLIFSSVPYGALNPAPDDPAHERDINAYPLTFTASVEGTYTYNLQGGAGSITVTAPASAAVQTTPQTSGLSMTVNPSPSNGAATITITSDKQCDLQLALFDASGKQVHAFEDVKLISGEYSLPLSSASLPSGEYFLRAISARGIVATSKVLIVH